MIAMPWSAEMKIRLDTEMRSLLSGLWVDAVPRSVILDSVLGGINPCLSSWKSAQADSLRQPDGLL